MFPDHISYAAAMFEDDSGSDEEPPNHKPYLKVKDMSKGLIELPNGYIVDCTGDKFKDKLEDPFQLFKLQFQKGEMCKYARMESMLREKKAARYWSKVLFLSFFLIHSFSLYWS